MSIEASGARVERRGRTTIRPRAISRLVEAVVAEKTGVRAAAVRVELSDRHGRLAVKVTSPLDLGAGTSAGTLVDRANAVVESVTSRLSALAGRSAGRVDVRFTGVRRSQERRRVQ